MNDRIQFLEDESNDNKLFLKKQKEQQDMEDQYRGRWLRKQQESDDRERGKSFRQHMETPIIKDSQHDPSISERDDTDSRFKKRKYSS